MFTPPDVFAIMVSQLTGLLSHGTRLNPHLPCSPSVFYHACLPVRSVNWRMINRLVIDVGVSVIYPDTVLLRSAVLGVQSLTTPAAARTVLPSRCLRPLRRDKLSAQHRLLPNSLPIGVVLAARSLVSVCGTAAQDAHRQSRHRPTLGPRCPRTQLLLNHPAHLLPLHRRSKLFAVLWTT